MTPVGAGGGPRIADLVQSLVARAPRGMVLGLDRVLDALAAVGDPHLEVPAVHVAGSNGKGSTSAMVESVARAAGLRTGLYTSPHLCRFAERIRLDGVPIDDLAFARCLGAVIDRCRPDLTFFESLTVTAFLAFQEANVDVAVLEVGLGGRLDATNVVPSPVATAITSISLEHTAILGDTLAAIAGEKAGILKPGAPVVLGPLPAEADEAIAAVAARVGAGPIFRVQRIRQPVHDRGSALKPPVSGGPGSIAVHYDGSGTEVRGPGPSAHVAVELRLAGAHQAGNAGVAVGLVHALAARFPGRDFQRALPEGLSGATWPGRCERIEKDGVTVLLDAAHNPEGALALRHAARIAPDRAALVFGALEDKRWTDMLQTLAPLASRRYYTCPRGREPASPEALAALAPGVSIPDPRAALARAIAESSPGDTVIVTGSIYLVGELRADLLAIAADPVIAL
jgi:dihydrofolate synthase/folylpolyglutamate synthase